MKQTVSVTINGELRELDIEPYRSLLDVLREEANLTSEQGATRPVREGRT